MDSPQVNVTSDSVTAESLGAARMDPAIKAKWVAALRSGEYDQATGYLRHAEGFCCLGVLCDLYASEHSLTEWSVGDLGASDGDDETAGPAVQAWAGLRSDNPFIRLEEGEAPISTFNDGQIIPATGFRARRRTFAEIADAIEAQL